MLAVNCKGSSDSPVVVFVRPIAKSVSHSASLPGVMVILGVGVIDWFGT